MVILQSFFLSIIKFQEITNTQESLSTLITHAHSFTQSDQLQTDVNVALSNLLNDIQNKTCEWVCTYVYLNHGLPHMNAACDKSGNKVTNIV